MRTGNRPTVVQVVLELDRGGLETMCADLACALVTRGVRSVVVGLDRGGRLESRLAAGGVEFVSAGGRRLRDPRFHWQVASLLRAFRPTAVHAHSFGPLLFAIPGALLSGARVVNTEHSVEYLEHRADFRRLLRGMAHFIDRFAVLGDRMRSYYADLGIAAERLVVIPNGVDVPAVPDAGTRAAARAKLGVDAGFLVGTVGRLAPEKNFPMLLQAFAQLHAHRPDSALVFVGDGEEREALSRVAAGLGITPHVHFMGWRTDVSQLLPALDLFVLSSHSEGLPMAMLEGMAAGVPVLSTAVGDIPGVLAAGDAGRLVPAGDLPAFAGALLAFATDGAARASTAARGRALVEARYSRARMVDAYLDAYGLAAAPTA